MATLLSSQLFLTKLRAEELENELKYLKDIKEPEIAQKIRGAREMGNLEDNSEFDLAIEQQSFIANRIREIESILANAKIIKNSSKTVKVNVGSTVIVEVEGRQDAFTIVGISEAAPLSGKISHESPVGKALMGSQIGQEVLVETEVYSTMYKIIDIKNG